MSFEYVLRGRMIFGFVLFDTFVWDEMQPHVTLKIYKMCHLLEIHQLLAQFDQDLAFLDSLI